MFLRVGLYLLLFLVSNTVLAHGYTVTVKLREIKVVKQGEHDGDEIYFTVTKYSNKDKSDQARVPMYPKYWRSNDLRQHPNSILWQGELKDAEVQHLIFSLIEHDAPPWNVDDHLGSMKLTLNNSKHRVEQRWSFPDYSDQPVGIAKGNKRGSFILKGESSEYHLQLDVDISDR